jgi:hypothetical protein
MGRPQSQSGEIQSCSRNRRELKLCVTCALFLRRFDLMLYSSTYTVHTNPTGITFAVRSLRLLPLLPCLCIQKPRRAATAIRRFGLLLEEPSFALSWYVTMRGSKCVMLV